LETQDLLELLGNFVELSVPSHNIYIYIPWVYACFLDASKAFDCVVHEKLCCKLLDKGLPINVVKVLYYWFKNQNYVFSWGGKVSRSFVPQRSVRQGGVLSPYLFNLYMDGLGELLDKADVGCRIGRHYCNKFWYADDLCLLAPSRYALQKSIDIASKYVDRHTISFNTDKTVCMQFSASCEKHLVTPTIFLGNTSLNWVDSFNYLGYTFTNKKQADDLEIEKRLKEAKIRANVVGTRFRKASHDVKQLLFSTFFCILLMFFMDAK